MQKQLKVLIVEDCEDDALLVIREIRKGCLDAEAIRVDSQETLLSALKGRNWDIVLCDYSMPHFSGLAALKIIREMSPDLPVIIVSGTIGEDVAVDAMRAGANDYLMKDNLKRLVPAVERELRDTVVRLRRKQAEEALKSSEERFRSLFQNSPLPIWEEDLSVVKKILTEIAEQGIDDIEPYLKKHPEIVKRCAESFRVTDVNQAALVMHKAANKEELLENLSMTFVPESYATFESEIAALWNGKFTMSNDTIIRTLDGEERHVTVYCAVSPGFENTLSKVLVTIVDITERKRSEERIRQQLDELQRWHHVTLDRENRVLELKREVNELLARLGQAPRYLTHERSDSVEVIHS